MKVKVIAAIIAITLLAVLLFLATATALMAPTNGNATSNGSFRWWPFDDDSSHDFGEGGMMGFWGPSSASNGNTGYYGEG